MRNQPKSISRPSRTVPLLAALALTSWLAASAASQDPTGDAKDAQPKQGDRPDPLAKAAVYHHDFRGRPVPVELVPMNIDGTEFMKEEPQGLRITLPKTFTHAWGGVGLKTAFGFGGDFEVTAAVEVLENEVPPAGYGVGAILALNAGKHIAGIGRLVKANGQQMIYVERNDPVWAETRIPSNAQFVRLRLKRQGPTLHFLWSPDAAGDAFNDVAQCKFGDEDLKGVRLTGSTGMKPCKLDVRLIDLRIVSQRSDLPAAIVPAANADTRGPTPIAPVAGPPTPRERNSLVAVLLVGMASAVLLIVILGLGAVLFLRKRGAAAGAAPPAGAIACPKCARLLKTTAEMAGKKVKCARCNTVVLVPAVAEPEA